jgi:probable rRNA maturation factor
VIEIAVENRSGDTVDEGGAEAVARAVLAAEGITSGDLGIAFAPPDEMRALKLEHLGIDEATDVLSFPIDGNGDIHEGVPRQLGDVVLCPQVVGAQWRRPLVHGLLHLLGYDHGEAMEERERALADRA